MKKWIAVGTIVVIMGGGSWYIWGNKTESAVAKVPSVATKTGKLDVKVSGSGSLSSVANIDVKSDVAKVVDTVLVTLNSEVKAGQNILTFTDGTTLTAPADGTFTSLDVKATDRLAVGKVIGHVTNYKQLQTVIQVDELDVPKVQVGQSVTLKINSYPDDTFTGKVVDIAKEGTVSNGVSTFGVTVSIDDIKSVKIGMTAEASILTASKDNVLLVPVAAVHSQGAQKFVLEGDGKQVQRKMVKTGLHNEDAIEITEGLTQGEEVQLPALATSNGTNNRQGTRQGFGGGGFGGGFGGGGNRGGAGAGAGGARGGR